MKKNNLYRFLTIIVVVMFSLANNSSFAQNGKKGKRQPDIKVTLNAYSFNDLLQIPEVLIIQFRFKVTA